jgi:DNA-binding transcriptional MocR family regulator
MLQYRHPQEFLDCRQGVASLLSDAHGLTVSPDHIAITP